MFNRYYQEELRALRELGAEFAAAHPAIANMLSDSTGDPDVERLLEGVAFLTGLLKHKIEDEFPEFIHELFHLIFPHYLRPFPSAAIVAFKPKPSLKNSVKIPAETQLSSMIIDNKAPCIYQTCSDVDVHPIRLGEAVYMEPPGQMPGIRLTFDMLGIGLQEWKPGSLKFYLSGDYVDATNLYYLLRTKLSRIVISAGDSRTVLSPDHFKPCGFEDHEGLIAYPGNAFQAYRVLQEYFILPRKFLFFEITGLEKWEEREDTPRFQIYFELQFEKKDLPFPMPRVETRSGWIISRPNT